MIAPVVNQRRSGRINQRTCRRRQIFRRPAELVAMIAAQNCSNFSGTMPYLTRCLPKRHQLATRSSQVPARTGLANLRCHFLTFRQVLAAVQKLTLPVKQHLIRTINGSFRVTGLINWGQTAIKFADDFNKW